VSEDDDLGARRRALRERIGRQEAERDDASRRSPSAMAGYAAAFRLSTEFVSAIVVGGLIGYAADALLGTLPWLLILFLLLGFVAGVLNVLRSAGLIRTPRAGKRPPKPGNGPEH